MKCLEQQSGGLYIFCWPDYGWQNLFTSGCYILKGGWSTWEGPDLNTVPSEEQWKKQDLKPCVLEKDLNLLLENGN